MNLVSYIRNHGFRNTLDIVYMYKIDQVLRRFFAKITKKKPLKNLIVIEGHNDFDSNAGAFYDYLIDKYSEDEINSWHAKK